MTLQQLIYFQKIAELEHYTRAAEVLNISQPGLSYAMAELEKELGVSLFYKKGRNIKLTSFGEHFLDHVNIALNEIELGCREIADQINPDRGVISLVHISSMNQRYMPFLLRKFYANATHANIKLEFNESPTLKFIDGIKQRKYDVGFGSYISDSELEFFKVYQETMVLIVGRNHPLAGYEEITLPETAGYDFIEYNRDCGIRDCIDKLFQSAKVERNIINEFEDNHMIVGMVASGMGIAVVPQMYGSDYYNVKTIKIRGVDTNRGLYMIWLKDGYMAPAVKKFINFVKSLEGEPII